MAEIFSEDNYIVDGSLPTKECCVCGKLFNIEQKRNAHRVKYCPRQHYSFCEICGKRFNLSQSQIREHVIKTVCSQKCLNLKVVRSAAASAGVSSEGLTNVSQISSIRDKISASIKTKGKEISQKAQATMIEKYGAATAMQVPELRAKIDATNLERYGNVNPAKNVDVRRKISDKISSKEVQTKYVATSQAHSFTRISNLNQNIAKKLNAVGIETEFEFYIDGKWYDLHILNSNIVLEIDPTYTHSSVPSHWMKEGIDKNYHFEKTTIANEHGYRCIHIFDWDDIDKVISVVKPTQSIYGRKCEVKEIDIRLANSFLNDFHLQGSTNGVIIALGLYYNYQLVEVMTLGRCRYNKNYEWELLRLCTISDLKVIGGASKLLKYFINRYNPQSILSYCDAAKFSGSVYQQIGMKLHHTSAPAKIWSKDKQYITDNLLRQRGFDQLFNTSYGKGTSNEELMLSHKWLPVYDCGQYVYVWNA